MILGTGKLAKNIGLFFLKKKYPVCWASRDHAYLSTLKKSVTREMKRLQGDNALSENEAPLAFYPLPDKNMPQPDIVIETTHESIDKKRQALGDCGGIFTNDSCIVLSNSSSILPWDIHPSCVGCHFFFPVELTGIVEVLFPESFPASRREAVLSRIRHWDLLPVVQSARNAFAINRLLLPLQAECFRMLLSGAGPQVINAATISELIPFGQLSFMDSVGLEVIQRSVENYVFRMPPSLQPDYAPLVNGLRDLVASGKSGNKNRNGLLTGSPLPWPASNGAEYQDMEILKRRFLYLFLNTCHSFLKTEQISMSDLAVVFHSLFHSDKSAEQALQEQGNNVMKTRLETWYAETGASYFKCEAY